jgi:hypothetical protein
LIDNKFLVQKRQWKKWNSSEQTVFNHLYTIMIDNQDLFKHPLGATQSKECWKTTCWNAAWTAADILRDERKHGR